MSYRHIPIHDSKRQELARQLNIQLTDIERAFADPDLIVTSVSTEPKRQTGYLYWFASVPGFEYDGLYIWDGTAWILIGPEPVADRFVGIVKPTADAQTVTVITAGVWAELTQTAWTSHVLVNVRQHPTWNYRWQLWKDGTLGAKLINGEAHVTGSIEMPTRNATVQVTMGYNGVALPQVAANVYASQQQSAVISVPFTIYLPIVGHIETDYYSIFATSSDGNNVNLFNITATLNLEGEL